MGTEEDFKKNADVITTPQAPEPSRPETQGNTENTSDHATTSNSPPGSQDLKLG